MDRQPLLRNTEPDQSFQPLSPQLLPTVTTAAYLGTPQAKEFPSAPPAHLLDDVTGYEGTIGGEEHFVPPPLPAAEGTERLEPHPQRAWSIPTVTEEMAREAFIQYASSICCYSVKPAKEMAFRDLKPCNTYRYRLESFTESRSTEWTSKPYTGQFVDSNAYGPAPLPWDIVVHIPQLFQEHTEKVPVPHTSSVKGCHSCMALGRTACTNCTATGRVRCQVCSGRGFKSNDRCNPCHGSGLQRCVFCGGSGAKPCKTCAQSGQLLVYIQLIVKWKNNIFEYIADQQSGLSLELYDKMAGDCIFTDEQVMVSPIVAFPEIKITQASQQAIQQHRTQLTRASVIIQQRQTIEFIPITEVYYEWKGKEYSYFTCGTDNRVHAPDYPAKCCCCTIL
ncbi:protein SSUH2 homolog [Hypanus sabinus]|uniref:protein SSUH2 homolog n=1 Tax=Hypanus sabinus TaxID=79690 RepID=UPI0028C48364|nr:protein SSUH2 homolog [Hypanus sabinus]